MPDVKMRLVIFHGSPMIPHPDIPDGDACRVTELHIAFSRTDPEGEGAVIVAERDGVRFARWRNVPITSAVTLGLRLTPPESFLTESTLRVVAEIPGRLHAEGLSASCKVVTTGA